jgi:hypothetical protein
MALLTERSQMTKTDKILVLIIILNTALVTFSVCTLRVSALEKRVTALEQKEAK